eukprot:250497-Alexandrium_andersonii.AAC.1
MCTEKRAQSSIGEAREGVSSLALSGALRSQKMENRLRHSKRELRGSGNTPQAVSLKLPKGALCAI